RRVDELRDAIEAGDAQLGVDVVALGALRETVQQADDVVSALRTTADQHELAIKDARTAFESIRAIVSDLDIARATAEADLSHLASSCLETVQATLDEVTSEVADLERGGAGTPGARGIAAAGREDSGEQDDEESDEDAPAADGGAGRQTDLGDPGAAVLAAEQHALSAE